LFSVASDAHNFLKWNAEKEINFRWMFTCTLIVVCSLFMCFSDPGNPLSVGLSRGILFSILFENETMSILLGSMP
jgi:hypothetical protein